MNLILSLWCLFLTSIFSGLLLPSGDEYDYPCDQIVDFFQRHTSQSNRSWVPSKEGSCLYQSAYDSVDEDRDNYFSFLVHDIEQEKKRIYQELGIILEEHGFPSKSVLEHYTGGQANTGSLIISLVESSQDKNLRALCLGKMIFYTKENGSIGVHPEDFARLLDTHLVAHGEPQEYGTMHARGLKQNNTYVPAPPVRDPETLKERRRDLGLDSYKPSTENPRFSLVFGNQSFLVDPENLNAERSAYSYFEEYRQAGLFVQGKTGIRLTSGFNITLSLSNIFLEENEKLFILDNNHALEVFGEFLHLNRDEFLTSIRPI